MACTIFPQCDCKGFCQFGPTINGVKAVTTAQRPKAPKAGARWTPEALNGQPCEYCGVTMDMHHPWRRPTRDHILPRSKGGTNVQSNLTPSCAMCNETKGAMTIREFYEWLVETRDPRAERVGRFMARLPREMV